MEDYLQYDPSDDRFTLGTEILHCGSCLEVYRDGEWKQTRLEMDVNGSWYLIGFPCEWPNGWLARFA